MQKRYWYHIRMLVYRILFLLLLFQVGRIYFFVLHYSRYSPLPFSTLLQSFLVGIRFDIAAISMLNVFFILLSLLPLSLVERLWYQKLLKWIFVLPNAIFLGANIIDAHYFKFTQKRSTFDIFHTLSGSDFRDLLYEYIRDYWVAFGFVFLLIWILYRFYPSFRAARFTVSEQKKFNLTDFLKSSFWSFIVVFLFVIFARGLDHRPIAITSAAKFADSKTIALTLNTPFTLIKTIYKEGLEPKKYFLKSDLKQYFSPLRNYQSEAFKKKNVVILILESFGKEYSDFSGVKKKTHTPFLDSLSHKGLYFTNSFANGQVSMESVSSILNASPSLMERPYLISSYASNKVKGLAYLLAEKGYETSFMHGGSNGTMDFDKFCFMSGFKAYYGRKEYHNEADYDGNWGIFDEPFLQYSILKMNHFKPPFFNTIFTLSSHHPYTVPYKYKGRFKRGSLKIHRSVEYADFALQQFFAKAAQEDWFKNTLFVITADHTSISEEAYYQDGMGAYAVPIIFYAPGDSTLIGVSDKLIEHADIMPSILDYLSYPDTFYAIGKSTFDSLQKPYLVNYNSNRYLFANQNFYSEIVEDTVLSVYRYQTDSLLENNLLLKNKDDSDSVKAFLKEDIPVFKALIQTYNNDLIDNQAFFRSNNNSENK